VAMAPAVDAATFEPSHWGTELAALHDPDGREVVLQRPASVHGHTRDD
jgi:hypothetical protein